MILKKHTGNSVPNLPLGSILNDYDSYKCMDASIITIRGGSPNPYSIDCRGVVGLRGSTLITKVRRYSISRSTIHMHTIFAHALQQI
jgi:hypothetical protein